MPLSRVLLSIFLALVSITPLPADETARPAKVRVVKDRSGWVLKVNDKPFYIKGIACNEGLLDGVDYLKLVAAAGANTVRIYGDAAPEYLDLARQHGLMVNVGFWTNAIRLHSKESYRNPLHTLELKKKILAYVRWLKDHPAVLAWTLGNETFIFSDAEEERRAYGRFLEDIVKAVHQEDPNHPVIYASSYTRCLPYLKKFVPSIDIIGVNVTGGAGPAISWAERNDFDRPVIVTEFAPLGSWETRQDANQMPYDPFDQFKADTYLSSWRQMQANPRSCIGGFAFVMGGFRNQDSLTWYNMNYGELRRAGYWMVRELYTGRKPENRPPKIVDFFVDPKSGLKPGSWTSVRVRVSDPESDPLTYDYFLTNIAKDPLIVEKAAFFPGGVRSSEPGAAEVQVPQEQGTYRIYVGIKDGQGNIAIADRTVRVD